MLFEGRPSEKIQAVVSSVVGAVLILLGAFDVEFAEKLSTPVVFGAVVLLSGYVAAGVTWFVAQKQRGTSAELKSSKDGTVAKA